MSQVPISAALNAKDKLSAFTVTDDMEAFCEAEIINGLTKIEKNKYIQNHHDIV